MVHRVMPRRVTGHGASRTTFSATLPRSTWCSPVRPWVVSQLHYSVALAQARAQHKIWLLQERYQRLN